MEQPNLTSVQDTGGAGVIKMQLPAKRTPAVAAAWSTAVVEEPKPSSQASTTPGAGTTTNCVHRPLLVALIDGVVPSILQALVQLGRRSCACMWSVHFSHARTRHTGWSLVCPNPHMAPR